MISTASSAAAISVAREWDELRVAFASSLLVDTPLSSLAQNLDGRAWPFPGPDEKPSTYIDYNYGELLLELTERGRPQAAPLLLQILRETLAFDQPFGEMVRQTALAAARENPLLRALGRLCIPEDFPLTLATLDATARELCQLEHIRTLGHFALFAQGLAQNGIVGGDFRALVNALAHTDEQALAAFIPFRPGALGLHLAEALTLAARDPQPAERVAHTLAWFAAEFADWQRLSQLDARFLTRQFYAVRDPALERRIFDLLTPHLRLPVGRRSFRSRLAAWLGL